MDEKKAIILRLMLRLQDRPCKISMPCPHCCLQCPDVITCYETWKRGNLRRCKVEKDGKQLWCPPIAEMLASSLGDYSSWNLPPSTPAPSGRIEEWKTAEEEDE